MFILDKIFISGKTRRKLQRIFMDFLGKLFRIRHVFTLDTENNLNLEKLDGSLHYKFNIIRRKKRQLLDSSIKKKSHAQ
jgi:hypothetical protein